MRKHSVRKFIHAILDLLPLIVIPIFAIYSQNHEINDNTLQVQENKVVDFNQLRVDELTTKRLNVDINITNGLITFDGTPNINTISSFKICGNNTTIQGHIYAYLLRNYYDVPRLSVYSFSNNGSGTLKNIYNFTTYGGDVWYKFQSPEDNCSFELGMLADTSLTYLSSCYIDVFDLTQMGLESISLNDFLNYFDEYSYQYTESQEMVIENYETITYDDTDIMSQFMYVTYNSVDKYFNMNNVFNLHGIWNWVSNTLFGGQPPISAFIVYNVIAYEFIMDIIFLIYMVLMFVIDFAESGIDRFMKRGCR